MAVTSYRLFAVSTLWVGLQRSTVKKRNLDVRNSYLLFCNPTNKTETETANRWGIINHKPPEPIIMMGQSETLSPNQIVFIYTLFCTCTGLLRLLHSTASKTVTLSQNYFPEPNQHTFIFLHPVRLFRINTLSTVGDVLTAYLPLSCSQSAIISNLPRSQQSCMCFVLAPQIRLIKLDFYIKILSLTFMWSVP